MIEWNGKRSEGRIKNIKVNMSIIKKILIVIGVILSLIVVVQVINAAKYKMVINVVEGENIMGLNPLADKLDFGDLSRNNGMTRYVTLKSGGGISTFVVVWQFGEITDLVKVNKNLFTLKPGEEVKLSFEIQIPPSAEIKQYSGRVWIFRLPKLF
ncbi:MAG TPA: hypothetical protein ENI19_02645 [Candidatus Nealsonbacteria bacterium]|uniref:Uncharacterized protein n=1 Tax=marine sediment metagenome TaxID=412755 RepID=A0A0F9WNC3_9ZZZZ|nr:hypothetical protein [Candidatus Nealsonbacteria bacterium]HEB46585.1 hypothetical protein [Candidatus Nealsonbacteria bacterium]